MRSSRRLGRIWRSRRRRPHKLAYFFRSTRGSADGNRRTRLFYGSIVAFLCDKIDSVFYLAGFHIDAGGGVFGGFCGIEPEGGDLDPLLCRADVREREFPVAVGLGGGIIIAVL